jgi:hypothetical protein
MELTSTDLGLAARVQQLEALAQQAPAEAQRRGRS